MDMKFIFDLSWIMYFITLILLIAVIFIGKSSHGAQRWIAIGSFALQPSEFSKIAIILALAKFMSSNIEDNLRISFIITSIFIVIVPLVIILKQPDLGTSLTLIPILTTMLFMAGIKKRYFMMLLPFALIPLIIIFLA
ncbi:MAG: Rod shape-determining protein RodA, partial [uncultured bacterium]